MIIIYNILIVFAVGSVKSGENFRKAGKITDVSRENLFITSRIINSASVKVPRGPEKILPVSEKKREIQKKRILSEYGEKICGLAGVKLSTKFTDFTGL